MEILGPFRGFPQNFIHTRKEHAPQAALSGRDPLSCFSKCFFASRQPLRTISILPWPPKHLVMWLLPPCHLVPAALVCKELPPLSSRPPCTSHLSATAGAPRSATDMSPLEDASVHSTQSSGQLLLLQLEDTRPFPSRFSAQLRFNPDHTLLRLRLPPGYPWHQADSSP